MFVLLNVGIRKVSLVIIHKNCNIKQELKADLDSVKREVLKTQECYPLEFQHLGNVFNLRYHFLKSSQNLFPSQIMYLAGMKLKELVDAAENYHVVLAENRKLYNEVQDLKGTLVHSF